MHNALQGQELQTCVNEIHDISQGSEEVVLKEQSIYPSIQQQKYSLIVFSLIKQSIMWLSEEEKTQNKHSLLNSS